jgi:hypothetical protein
MIPQKRGERVNFLALVEPVACDEQSPPRNPPIIFRVTGHPLAAQFLALIAIGGALFTFSLRRFRKTISEMS